MVAVTPLWFVVLMAILVTIIMFSAIGIFATNNKIKKGAGYKGTPPTKGGGGATCP